MKLLNFLNLFHFLNIFNFFWISTKLFEFLFWIFQNLCFFYFNFILFIFSKKFNSRIFFAQLSSTSTTLLHHHQECRLQRAKMKLKNEKNLPFLKFYRQFDWTRFFPLSLIKKLLLIDSNINSTCGIVQKSTCSIWKSEKSFSIWFAESELWP